MNAQNLARQAYTNQAAPIRTTRGTEYEVFAKITHRLNAAARKGKMGFPALASAIHDNRKLWTMLAADVADDDNGLPNDLRARIFYLAEFTQVHSRKVLKSEASAAALIEINAAMMRGLRSGSVQP
ncbi:flagellar biosynthesis regulatory protein FlaF [Litorivita pollutaquae]|uniref:Flagellar biosynthesis regulatory protein FlaF n=1 Tax=Litorivita pollutaquae TaxID=2200892 RepID=A0A2V4NM05_9RHOB|nr:flagellar biosynthesis regulator FlaF [Litorivita pollutaquae]OUS19593.1 flagellar biosynthesis regulator FlhF [Rhodobacterales bacterium 59_46_T64]PYC47377.1 flagellar biosynthesis regulatory protein FlaF [Litorivita pollutaquae]